MRSRIFSDGNLVTQLGKPQKSFRLRSTFHTSPAHGTETTASPPPPRRCGNGLPPPPRQLWEAIKIWSRHRLPHTSTAGRDVRQLWETFSNFRTREEEDLQGNFGQLIPGEVEVRESQSGEEAGAEEIGEKDGEREATPREVVGRGDEDGGTCVHHLQRLVRLVQSVLEI